MSEGGAGKGPEGLDEQLRTLFQRGHVPFFTQAEGGQPSQDADSPAPAADRLDAIRGFKLKPRDIRDYLNRFVIRQDEAKKVLSVAICDHYNHVRRCMENPDLAQREHIKHNILLLGPTGVGKTYIMRCIARLIGVPFVRADATKFSETGYVGRDVEDLVRDLVKAAEGDVDLAQYGIIYMDEIDKIASQSSAFGKDVSGRGVQVNLLKLMEETDVSLFSQTDLIGQMQAVMEMQRGRGGGRRTVNTRHILFIVSGAFDKLPELVRKRVAASQIGFGVESEGATGDAELLKRVQTRDFIEYGFEPEFVGRLPVRVAFDPLSADDLEQILLTSEGSIMAQYVADFEGYGVEFRMKPDAVRAVAERAHGEQTGARGLMTVMEGILRNFKFELPSSVVRRLDLDRAAVEHPDDALRSLLKENESARREAMRREVAEYAAEFDRAHGLRLVFEPDAVEAVVEACVREDRTVRSFCETRFHDFEYGFKLIARNSDCTQFSITAAIVASPSQEVSRLIAESFKARNAGQA